MVQFFLLQLVITGFFLLRYSLTFSVIINVTILIQGGGRGDRPDPSSLSRPVHGVDSSRALHRVDADPTPAAYDTENALPNCMCFHFVVSVSSSSDSGGR